MSRLKQLVHEIHRRSLWQVLGLYLGTSFVVLQVTEQVTSSVGLPDWVQPFILVLLLVGLPIVLGTAFVQEGIGSRAGAVESAGSPSGSGAAEHPPTEATLEPVAEESRPLPAGLAASRAHHRWLTWKNALIGGAAAFMLLGLVTAGYMAMRSLGIGPAGTLVAKGLLDERAPILLAEFGAADSSLARAATEAFRVDLAQSRVVRLAEPAFVRAALTRMQRPRDTRIDLDLGQELAHREGVPAVIGGEINAAGTGYVLTARLVSALNGEILASHRETASGPEEIIGALDRLSRSLRERIGESLRTIRAEAPLEKVTTGDLEALRKYSQAVRAIDSQGDDDRGIALLEEAVGLDTSFAMAWRKLGVTYGNRSQKRTRLVEALTKAFAHRDRLTERERYLAMGAYYDGVLEDPGRTITAYESLLELDPEDPWALNNLALQYLNLREPDRAVELLERALAADSSGWHPYVNLAAAQTNLGEYGEARATLETLARRVPGTPQYGEVSSLVAAAEGDYEEAERQFTELRRQRPGDLFWRSFTSSGLAAVAAVHGKLAEAERHLGDAEAAEEERDVPSAALNFALGTAGLDLLVREDAESGLARLQTALERHPLDSIEPLNRPYLQVATFLAQAGRPDRARSFLERFEGQVEPEMRTKRDLARTEATVALVEGRYEEAAEEFRRSDTGPCLVCSLPGLALAYDRGGRRDSAIAVYERYVERPSVTRLYVDAFRLARTYERLGQLYDEEDDLESAAKYYAKFVELWAEADPELQPRVRAAQKRLEEIVRQRG